VFEPALGFIRLDVNMAGNDSTITDAELGAKVDLSHEEVIHMAELTEEEKVVEKKLRRRIDALIMPMVILVYLMNYIDRYAMP
jgi:hypothetical protein